MFKEIVTTFQIICTLTTLKAIHDHDQTESYAFNLELSLMALGCVVAEEMECSHLPLHIYPSWQTILAELQKEQICMGTVT